MRGSKAWQDSVKCQEVEEGERPGTTTAIALVRV